MLPRKLISFMRVVKKEACFGCFWIGDDRSVVGGGCIKEWMMADYYKWMAGRHVVGLFIGAVILIGMCYAQPASACPNCAGSLADGDAGGESIYVHQGNVEFTMSKDSVYDGAGSNASMAYGYSIYFMMGTVYLVLGGAIVFTIKAGLKYRPAAKHL